MATQLNEMAQTALARPIELAFHFLVMNPEHVGRHDIDASRLHLEQFLAPFALRVTRVMELAHHGDPRLAVHRQVAAVGIQLDALRILSAHLELPRDHRRIRVRQIDGVPGSRLRVCVAAA